MKRVITTANAPEAIGRYAQAVEFNDLIFVSGQIPINPADGQLELGDIKAQTKLALSNLQAILNAANSDLDNCLRVTIFLKDMQQFSTVNDVYSSFFANEVPSRSCVEVSQLPKGVAIEIDAIAFKNKQYLS